MLGIAVTCANRQTFIAKIQSLDAETQHSLTQSAASFIIVKVAGCKLELETKVHPKVRNHGEGPY